jgi:HEAT repeat protein
MYRLAAVWALGHLASPEAIPVLQSVVNSDLSESVRGRASNALTKCLAQQTVATAAAA